MKNFKLFILFIFAAALFTSCTKDKVDPLEDYNNASAKNGGMLFDKLWRADAGFDQASANLETLNAASNFFRCKQCHGWDGLGNKGAYINRAPKTSRPNVTAFNLYEMGQTEGAQEIFDDLKESTGRRDISFDLSTYDPTTNNVEGDKMPNLNQLLTDAQMWDLVKFIKEGMLDVSNLYDATTTGTYPTGTWTPSNVGKDGNAANGNALYTANCASCHGADGTSIEVEKGTVGNFVRLKGNEAQHKILYGIEGDMPAHDLSAEEVKDLYKALADEVKFPAPAL